MILVITDVIEESADAVVRGLSHLGAPWVRLNHPDVPRRVALALSPTDPQGGHLVVRDRRVPLSEITAVWLWKARDYGLPDSLPAAERHFAAGAWEASEAALLGALGERCLVVNDPLRAERANDKPLQLRLAQRLGWAVPPSLLTNDPAAARDFCAAHEEVIFKVINRHPTIHGESGTAWIYTSLVRPADVAALATLQLCPGLFQARVPKRCDLRVTVVGDEVFAVEIHSQDRAETQVDFRKTWTDKVDLVHRSCNLPDPVRARCQELVSALGLSYAALDLVLTPEDEYVFLEVNPSGMFGWIQAHTGLPISLSLARLLAGAQGR